MANRIRQVGILVLFLLLSATAAAERRYALVIGNSQYEIGPLRNPKNDAEDISKKLKELNFRVKTLKDANQKKMAESVKYFYENLPEKDALALIYYAGHAVQLDNHNFLIPVGESIHSKEDLVQRSYDINHLFAEMGKKSGIQNVVILDACRNNPFKLDQFKENGRAIRVVPSEALRQLEKGLAPMEAPPGTLVAYATEPGDVAADGSGRNGTYTKHLLEHMDEQLDIEVIFKRVRNGVIRETRGNQIPWEHSSLYEAFFINPPKNRDMPSVIPF